MIIAHLADAPCTFVVPQTFTPSLQVRVRMDLDRAAGELTLEDFDSQVGLAMGRSQGTNRCGEEGWVSVGWNQEAVRHLGCSKCRQAPKGCNRCHKWRANALAKAGPEACAAPMVVALPRPSNDPIMVISSSLKVSR